MVQAKKVKRVQSAFELFNRMMQTPGKSELTLTELRVRSLNPACITEMLDFTVPLPHLVPVELMFTFFPCSCCCHCFSPCKYLCCLHQQAMACTFA